MLRPPLKWAGGKRWQVPRLLRLWKPFARRRLVEPFCGGLAVSLGLSPRRAVLSDINPHLIHFYQVLKRGLVAEIEMVNEEAAYYSCRERFNKLITTGQEETAEAASLFYYLNRTGYNGLCRFNRKGEFNVPFGRYKKITYAHDFTHYGRAFSQWTFMNLDFEKLPIRPNDFVYADPPYDVEFTQYSKGGFDWKDQVRTAEWLALHEGPVVLVNQATKRIVRLYKKLGYRITYLDAPRMISCTGDRTPAREVLATRNI